MSVAIIIPVRLKAIRLPGKPLAKIHDIPMMIHVGRRALESEVGEVVFACAEQELVDVANKNGFNAVLTDPGLPTGSDRVYKAYKLMNKKFDYIINLQGDMPFISPHTISAVYKLLSDRNDIEIATAGCLIKSDSEVSNPNVVKVVMARNANALYFTRAAKVPCEQGEYYKHIGIYGYTDKALETFVNLPPSPLEVRENLEQLRALENAMRIAVAVVEDHVQSVDTQDDLKTWL